MTSETYFATKTQNIEEISRNKDKNYTKIYLNTKKENDREILFLTRNEGQNLYIVSSVNHKNTLEYFSKDKENNFSQIEKSPKKSETGVKRQKQGSLLSFFKKKT